MSSLRQNWIFMQQSPKLKGHWHNYGNSKETDSNHLSKSCDPECKNHVPVVNKNCCVMTGEIWRGEVLFHSKLWRWGSKEKSIEKRERVEAGASPKGNKASAQMVTGKDLCLPVLFFSSFPLAALWKVLESSRQTAFIIWDLCLLYVQIWPFTCGLRKGQTGGIGRCRGYLN